jgi:hypothetical protein
MSVPIESIPDDVLAMIFICCFEQERSLAFDRAAPYEGENWKQERFRISAPFEIVATRVTRRWRNLAINLAPLWSNIFIVPFLSLKRLEIYLIRSRKALLDIYFMLDDLEQPPIEDEKGICLALSLAMLVPHVDRWRLCIIRSYSYPTIKQIVMAIHESAAPNLEHFVMCLRPSYSPEGLSCLEHAFQASIFTGGAPRLRYFECFGASIESCWPPTAALTDLRLDVDEAWEAGGFPAHPLTHNRFIELLRSVPSLANLRLRGQVVSLGHGDSIVEFPHLTSLAIDFDGDASYTSNLCSVISCPAVISLKLYQMTVSEIIDSFVDAIKKSHRLPKYPALTHLEIYDASHFPINSNFLAVLPTVMHLSLSKCTAVPAILHRLAETCSQTNGGTLWSSLQSLTINPLYPYWYQALCAFLVARIEIGCPLQNLRFNGCNVDIDTFLREHFEST